MISAQLVGRIDDELRWREAELALAKVQLQRSLSDSVLFRFSYRCFVAITYAHFEAFTKLVIAQAMDDIFNSGHPWSKCLLSIKTNLFAGGLRQILSKLSNSDLAILGSSSGYLIDSLPAPSLDIILDCGNMNITNFFWALGSIGLDPTRFAFARKDVGHLTALRHDCAHGEALTFDASKTRIDLASEIYALQARIILVMHTLAVEVLDHFDLGRFLTAYGSDAPSDSETSDATTREA